MSATSFSLDIGKSKCTVISDGFIAVGGPTPAGSTARPEDRPREIMDVLCLIVRQGSRRILVDTGCGTFFQASAGKLLENLKSEGINPTDIDTIVYTHAHPDHVGGTYDAELKLIFPRARQVIARKEWECFAGPETGPNSRMFSLARRILLPHPGHFDLVDDNAEVMPGVRLLPALGHTLGGVMIEISSGREKMVCIGDLIHSQREFTEPEFYSFLDSAPGEALRLRTSGIEEMAKAKTLIFACHMPFPGIGRFVKRGGVLGWEPIKS